MERDCLKYIQIRHWDYWWGVYQLGKKALNQPNAAEFSVTDAGDEDPRFFHFDFYNLSGLQEAIRDEEYIDPDDPDYPSFLYRTEALKQGSMEYFIGGLYYREFAPDLAFCNQPLTPGHTLLDLRAPAAAPCYAVLFLGEKRPLTPEILSAWMTRLSRPLFGRAYAFKIANVPTREEALASWREEASVRF